MKRPLYKRRRSSYTVGMLHTATKRTTTSKTTIGVVEACAR
jgi:hypothetical protein